MSIPFFVDHEGRSMVINNTQVSSQEVEELSPMERITKLAEREAKKASTQLTTPSEAICAEELLVNGWTHVHASIFWRAPNGELFPSTSYAWQSMKQGTGNIKHCSLCGQQVPA